MKKRKKDKVNYRKHDGVIAEMSYKKLIKHEKSIIEDNILYGMLHPYEYSEEDIEEYRRDAYLELRELKQILRENPDIILVLDSETERFVPE